MESDRNILAPVQESPKRHSWLHDNFLTTVLPFSTGAVFAAVSFVNNVRDRFHHAFVNGYGETKTPFHEMNLEFDRKFQEKSDAYRIYHTITADDYKKSMRDIAADYRQAVADKTLKEFNIPTYGWRGWTEGTYKRFNELGKHARVQSGVGVALFGFAAIGAMAVMRANAVGISKIRDETDDIKRNMRELHTALSEQSQNEQAQR